ncbi:hypothetical protein ACFV42_41545 [Streptomyces solisilvae]
MAVTTSLRVLLFRSTPLAPARNTVSSASSWPGFMKTMILGVMRASI